MPWNDWYHITGHTYGTWLPFDPRGWKTRHARRQPGDRPATETDRQNLHDHAVRTLRRPPVSLSAAARQLALDTIVTSLLFHKIELITAAVAEHHFHILARFPDHLPRRWVGIAKKESARALSKSGHIAEGGAWAVRCHCDPIKDREHQLHVAKYIAGHEAEGGVVWAAWPKKPAPPIT